jgi:hypothetical protein
LAYPGTIFPAERFYRPGQQGILTYRFVQIEDVALVDSEGVRFLQRRQRRASDYIHCGDIFFFDFDDNGTSEKAQATATIQFKHGIQDAFNQNAPGSPQQTDFSFN